MAVNGYAAAQDVEDLKASTAALAVAMGQRVNSNEAELAAFAETIVPLPGQLEEITNSLSTRLVGTNNLSDLESPATSRTNLGATVVGAAVFTAADAAAARAALGAQAASADLAAIAALTSAEDKLPYATGAGTWSLTNFTAFARTLLASANNSAFLVALGQIASTAINFLQGGTGGVQRGLQDKLRDCISVKDFGAVGDGVTDDAPAFNAALAASVGGLAGRAVYVPGSNARYKIGSTLVVPGGAKLIGDGARSSSFLIKAFNGTFMTIADGGQVHGLRMDGQGATYTGKGIEHIGGNQAVSDLFIYDTGDYTVYFTVTSGANCHYENVTAYVYGWIA